jgi:hypothetical protein
MKRLERIFLILGLVIAVGAVGRLPAREIARLATDCRGSIAAVIALGFVPQILDALGLYVCLPVDRKRLGLAYTFAGRLAGEGVNTIVPTATIGGEVVKVSLLSRRAPGRAVLAGVSTAYSLDALSTLVLVGVALPSALPRLDLPAVPRLGVAGVVLLATLGTYVFHRIVRHAASARRTKPEASTPAFSLAFAFLFASALWQTVEVALVRRGLGDEFEPLECFAIAALSALLDAVFFFVPGNLGTREGGLAGITALLGLGAPLGVQFALVRRLSQLVWAVAGYACFLVLGGDGLRETVAPLSEAVRAFVARAVAASQSLARG